jgi:glycosyltransferase involved in cell wall biosynthesis
MRRAPESTMLEADLIASAGPERCETVEQANAQSGGGGLRLSKRVLMFTAAVTPTPYADAFVADGLLSQLSTDEVVLVSNRTWANPAAQTHEPRGHRVHFIGSYWTWPKRGRRFVHWTKWLLAPLQAYRLVKLARAERCEAVFVHFPDEHNLCAALFAARFLSLDFFPFFHNTYRENRSGVARFIANRLQNAVLRRAALVFVMSHGMKSALEELYPDVEFQPLVHTFDGPVPAFQPLPPIDHSRIRIGCLGTISQANLDAVSRFCRVVESADNMELNLYTSAPEWQLRSQGLVGERIRPRQPADEELQETLRENDILFLPHGLTGGLAPIEYRTIFPTRTIPCLLSGRPLVAHSARGSFLSQWLKDNDCAELVEDPNPAALRSAIDRLCDNATRREQLVRNALRAAEQFRAEPVVGNMKRMMNRVWSKPPDADQ